MGDHLTMELTLPGMEQSITVQGEVRWIRDLNPLTPDMTPGMGVRFVDPPPDVVSAIESFARHKDPLFFDDE